MAYFWALADESSDLISQAAKQWMKNEKWFPKPAELIDLAADIQHQQPRQALPAPTQRPDEAYIRRVHAKCKAMGINHTSINRWMEEIEPKGFALDNLSQGEHLGT